MNDAYVSAENRELYLLKIGEIWLKGSNRKLFERVLVRNIKAMLAAYRPYVSIQGDRYFLSLDAGGRDEAAGVLSRTFGLTGYCMPLTCPKEKAAIISAATELVRRELKLRSITTFKVACRRSDKGFSLSSYEIACAVGDAVREEFSGLTVNLSRPDFTISVEVREQVYLYGTTYPAPGGLPAGTGGKGLLMLSGGIDSPVAGYLMGKRGLALDAVYFHAYPYTSDEAKDKVASLASMLSAYMVRMRLIVVPFTDVQLHIRRHALEKERTLHMRYAMVRITSMLAKQYHASCLVTGESLSQVASQTVQSIAYTNDASSVPVFRPLIGMDKEEIIRTAHEIGTYETSILPYEDCCTLFSPKHPITKPKKERLISAFNAMDMEKLLVQAAEAAEQQRLQS